MPRTVYKSFLFELVYISGAYISFINRILPYKSIDFFVGALEKVEKNSMRI